MFGNWNEPLTTAQALTLFVPAVTFFVISGTCELLHQHRLTHKRRFLAANILLFTVPLGFLIALWQPARNLLYEERLHRARARIYEEWRREIEPAADYTSPELEGDIIFPCIAFSPRGVRDIGIADEASQTHKPGEEELEIGLPPRLGDPRVRSVVLVEQVDSIRSETVYYKGVPDLVPPFDDNQPPERADVVAYNTLFVACVLSWPEKETIAVKHFVGYPSDFILLLDGQKTVDGRDDAVEKVEEWLNAQWRKWQARKADSGQNHIEEDE